MFPSIHFLLYIFAIYYTHIHVGPLGSVDDLETNSNASSIIVSCTAPFSLDVTDVDPDIWYSILIYNVTDDNLTDIPCADCNNFPGKKYIFTPDLTSPCHEYKFTVIPQNGVGNGLFRSVVGHIYRGI